MLLISNKGVKLVWVMEDIIENRINFYGYKGKINYTKNRNGTISVTWPKKKMGHIRGIGGSIIVLSKPQYIVTLSMT